MGTTEDELQAAALLISLKDSSTAPVVAPAGQKAENDAQQVSWAAFSGTTITTSVPVAPSGSCLDLCMCKLGALHNTGLRALHLPLCANTPARCTVSCWPRL